MSKKPYSKKKKAGSQTDLAYQGIKSKIMENSWSPGFSAFEHEIAEELNMSRTPVREALVRLDKEGLISLVPRRGVHVAPISVEDVTETYFVLAGLEGMAAELLAKSEVSSRAIEVMKQCSEKMDEALAKRQMRSWAQSDEKFHQELTRASGNLRLSKLAASLADHAHRIRMITLHYRPIPNSSNRDHRQIISAIEDGDWRTAARVAVAHRRNGLKMALKALENYSQSHPDLS